MTPRIQAIGHRPHPRMRLAAGPRLRDASGPLHRLVRRARVLRVGWQASLRSRRRWIALSPPLLRSVDKAEWYRACTQAGTRLYPYGNAFNPTACNTSSYEAGAPVPTAPCRAARQPTEVSSTSWETSTSGSTAAMRTLEHVTSRAVRSRRLTKSPATRSSRSLAWLTWKVPMRTSVSGAAGRDRLPS